MNRTILEENYFNALEKLEELKLVLKEIGAWDHDGGSVAEAWDYDHHLGAWDDLLRD